VDKLDDLCKNAFGGEVEELKLEEGDGGTGEALFVCTEERGTGEVDDDEEEEEEEKEEKVGGVGE
jgi:hypothetical protein